MRIHMLPFMFAFAVTGLMPGSVTNGFAREKAVSMGCTLSQLRTPEAKKCIELVVSEGTIHHLECSGGTVSCCNDEPDSHGLPAGFCIDIKKIGQTKRPKVIETPATTAQ